MQTTRTLALFALAAIALSACSADAVDESTPAAQTDALMSNTKLFLVPTSDAARKACRDELNSYYCTVDGAAKARAACAAKVGTLDTCGASGAGCVRFETYAEPCRAPAPIYPDSNACQSVRANSCNFYSACLETRENCGENGYALGYGERYCDAFKNAALSQKATAWMKSVMVCLQTNLIPYAQPRGPSPSCDALTEIAFDSHPACYTKPDHSVCFLPPSDALAVLQTIGGRELLAARTQKQIRSVIGRCVFQLGGFLLGFPSRSTAIASADAAGVSSASDAIGAAESTERNVELNEAELRDRLEFWKSLERMPEVR